jgi:DNA polymerase-3 subunit epsilon
MLKLLFFDLETTGVSPAKNGIHQISGELLIDGQSMEKFDFHVKPNEKAIIEEEALKIARVTKEQILNYPPMSEVYFKLTQMLAKYVDKFDKTDKIFLAGYNNASFDNQFLRGFFLQNGDPYFGSWFWSNSIDVMVLATQALLESRPEMENFKLSTVAKKFGIEVKEDQLHDAAYDIYLTRNIYQIITKTTKR